MLHRFNAERLYALVNMRFKFFNTKIPEKAELKFISEARGQKIGFAWADGADTLKPGSDMFHRRNSDGAGFFRVTT